ncbi:MAG: TetR/AcrR family transcriptional regulator [Sphingopyxis sp.]
MDSKRDFTATPRCDSGGQAPVDPKQPRTARGARTRKALIDAAAIEFGEKGFHEGSISGITSRAGVALGSFYTYFDSKDAIFRALVKAMSEQVRDHVAPALANAGGAVTAERNALKAFLDFASEHRELYRIIDEAEFVDPDSFRRHYETTAQRIAERLRDGAARGEVTSGIGEVEAWAIMGMNVFLGLRYGVWGDGEDHNAIADRANRMIANGVAVCAECKNESMASGC